jgi:hypothetical protein
MWICQDDFLLDHLQFRSCHPRVKIAAGDGLVLKADKLSFRSVASFDGLFLPVQIKADAVKALQSQEKERRSHRTAKLARSHIAHRQEGFIGVLEF